ncbi:MAG: hypothetical protein QME05_01090, partial [Candidatus Margulisbacteria bacterium]|nr:hypothetical protein [Candidatus Margulisiibacteriota bacterium]
MIKRVKPVSLIRLRKWVTAFSILFWLLVAGYCLLSAGCGQVISSSASTTVTATTTVTTTS